MSEPPDASWAHRLRDWWIEQIIRHHRVVLVLGLALTLVAGWLASRLKIDSDMRALLPRDHAVVHAIEHIEANFGAVGSINVVVQGGAASDRHALADAIATSLADEPMLREVDHRLASDFFITHALYYLDESDMDTLVERVEAWQHYQFCSAAPDVCIEAPDPDAPAALQQFIDAKREAVEQRAGFRDYYERAGIDALVLFLRPTHSSADLDYAVEVSDRMSERVSQVFARAGPWHAAGVRFNLVGPYVNKAAERKIIGRDMVRSGVVALLGVTVVLYLLFRSWRAIGTLLVPLACGVTWSLGATQLAIGHLNSITSLISSVVMGIGIDAGIHILARARREREDHDNQPTIRRAFTAVIAPLLVASCTTASAFVVMASSQFPAFGEFGVIAGFGVALCLLAMLTVYPALLALVGIKPARRMPPDGIGGATRVLLARPGLIFTAIVLLTLASFRGIEHMRSDGFERNTRSLQSDETRDATEADVFLISEIFGRNVHASVLSVPTYEELERVYERAIKQHARRVAADDTRVAELVAAPSLMPPKHIDQQLRHARITAMTEDWSPRVWAQLRGEDPDESDAGSDGWDDEFEPLDGGDAGVESDGDPDEETVETAETADQPTQAPTPTGGLDPSDGATLQRMLEAEPFGPEDLPPEAIGKLRGDDGSWGLFAYPNYDAADILTSVEFMQEVQAYADGAGTFAGEPTVYATIFTTLEDEWPVVIGMALSIIAAFVFWQVRSVGQTLVTIAPLALAFWWTFGILGAFDLKLTLFSVPILPAILGIGVDNGVYLTAAIRREQSTNTGLHRSVDETGRAILAATMTTAMGFGAFLVADSGGLRTIGQLAVIGILSTAVASLLAVPTIAALVQRRRDRLE
ncbi:efflux RND transporter permease subunit [Enhygromyxa salina]|uniref:MMPL family protein n=1 Tax=Enhygromyxa salina TaxID=215803 RepID=A0A2S9YLZ9_9BACT|nr:MMPL family transporter [Enhygromyxa salina]PRQ06111.1 MMPL family protein [Enhygromyxa salina]